MAKLTEIYMNEFLFMMRMLTVQRYINWYTEHMATRIEPNEFQIENWEKGTIKKLYQVGLIGFLQKFNGNNESITKEFINNYGHEQTMVGNLSIPLSP